MSIEKKRQRVHMEAIHRAEKAKQQDMLLGVAGMNRKGGVPNMKLRGINEADFFQKNNSDDKGFTFNFDGTLVDFRKPAFRKDLQDRAEYAGTSAGEVTTATGKKKPLK